MPEQGVRLRFRSDLRVEPEWFDLPEPGPGQILVRVSRSQVSAGTEMNFFRDHPIDGPLTSSALGYMTVGRVQEVGDGVTGYAPGDRVITSGLHGSHWLVSPNDPAAIPAQRYIDHLPDHVSDDDAGFVVLGDIALHGIRRSQLQIDEPVAVLGCGMIGQLTIQLARIAGAWPIIALDLLDDRLESARTSGATHVINAGDPNAVAQVFALTDGRGAGSVFHCAPVPQVLQTAMEMAAERGKVMLVGSPPGTATIGLQVELLRRELSIIGAYEVGIDEPHGYWPWSRRRNRQVCLRLLSTGQLSFQHLITHVRPAAEAEAMFHAMHDGTTPWMGIVFDWDDLSAVQKGGRAVSANPPQLHMKRRLTDLPDLAVPEGYALRSMRPDELPAWVDLLNQNGELGEWDLARADGIFRGGERAPYNGCFFITHDGRPVATAQLTLHHDGPYAPMPELGWVATSPDHRGRGLGSTVCLAVLQHAASAGFGEIFLLTDDQRLPALAIYFRLGFEPWMVDATAPERWAKVEQALGRW